MDPESTAQSAGDLEGHCAKGRHTRYLLGMPLLHYGSGHVEVDSVETRLAALVSSASVSLEEALWGGVMLLHSWRRSDMLGVRVRPSLCNLCWWAWYFLA